MKYQITIGLLIICLFSTSCSKEFLNKTDPTRIGTELFFKDQVQVDQAVNGVYGQLQRITNISYIFKEMMSDNTTFDLNPLDRGGAAGWEAFEFSTVNSGNGEISNLWNLYYSVMYNVNNTLGKLPNSEITDESKKQTEGELKFLRALLYFDLVRYWGDVVVVTKTLETPNEAFAQLRVPQAQVYTQIESDLKDAIASMPAKQPAAKLGRATKGSAISLLGEVYLTQKKYTEAVSTLNGILPLGYSLMPSYADVFDPNKKNNVESVFEIQYQGGNDLGEQSNFMYIFAPRLSGAAITGYASVVPSGRNIPTNDMIAAYEAGDLRKDVSLKTSYTATNGTVVPIPYVTKYKHAHTIAGRTDDNWPVIRYADVLLMLAEAINEATGPTAEAFNYLNRVRMRAGLLPLSGLDQTAFRTAVLQERRVELAFENHRWFDLKRTKTGAELVAFMNAHGAREKANPTVSRGGVAFNAQDYIYSENEVLLPIPAPQILINDKLTQNQGY
ncbi:RagB/SusD family nutrient uptake outer membrane protein [Segetibacter aerophilus]|uniref:Membrane protein n=1 Tax=Segetibacter aerophilus TaxID=670293 RepID=A0A512B6N4_9BACT|nr:RagB/SusD family nutrient uptake outer membrane protein [Segetibacter aerophilus]GEO07598.1 membrane protein [Segetibacter aerophilus]